jgi:beta-lactam-binding protein with PASTA domain
MAEVANETLVDGRYRIRERIGSGGMADVYCAEDTQLGRDVALKVLHRRFAQDQEFVKRFQREAQSAAALQHPNVVNVFDRGRHDGTYYIAMEYLPGLTLKEVIARDAPLRQEQAIDYALQVLQAAGFAHRRGVIHRDLKPHNVMVTGDGQVKVTDFGIARAGASEMTETGSIMGTAQYLSPEQAQGQGVSAASDLYSVGVILYELLTGHVPFAGDSAVSIALKHVSEPPPPPSQLRADLHPALEAVVMHALVKDPAGRFTSADEFTEALLSVREAIVTGADGGTAQFAPVALPPGEGRGGRRRWPWIAALGVLALVGGALALLLDGPDRVTVPAVVGQEFTVATERLEKAGFDVDVRRARNRAPVDVVFRQDPGGTRPGRDVTADEGSTVVLYVSNGPGERSVPSVEGDPRAVALRKLNDAGFRVDVNEEASATVQRGLAIRTVPEPGTRLEIGERVRLYISSGPARVQVPNVVGQSRASAESRLEAAGLTVVVDERESDGPEGRVLAQNPGAGADVEEGSRVTITVSIKRREVSVPAVVGLSESSARSRLTARGFDVQVRRVDAEGDDIGTVIRQSPSAGSDRREGSTVTIYVGREPADGGEEEPPPAEPPPPPDGGASAGPGVG